MKYKLPFLERGGSNFMTSSHVKAQKVDFACPLKIAYNIKSQSTSMAESYQHILRTK